LDYARVHDELTLAVVEAVGVIVSRRPGTARTAFRLRMSSQSSAFGCVAAILRSSSSTARSWASQQCYHTSPWQC